MSKVDVATHRAVTAKSGSPDVAAADAAVRAKLLAGALTIALSEMFSSNLRRRRFGACASIACATSHNGCQYRILHS